MNHKKPIPLFRVQEPATCPVCGKAAYSAARIHPQCAVTQADEERTNRLKREKSSKKPVAKSKVTGRWQKTCPKCKVSQHVRKKVCDCGHDFDSMPRPPVDQGDSL